MLNQFAAAVPAGSAVEIICGSADDTVSVLLPGLVNVKIIFKSVEMINLVAHTEFINVVFNFANNIRIYPFPFFHA